MSAERSTQGAHVLMSLACEQCLTPQLCWHPRLEVKPTTLNLAGECGVVGASRELKGGSSHKHFCPLQGTLLSRKQFPRNSTDCNDDA